MPSLTRGSVESRALDFLWNEWAQLGVLASTDRPSPWAQDLEALLVLTLNLARNDARLFDEVLDWLAHNESLLSQRRLRTIARAADTERLVAAASQWAARLRQPPDQPDESQGMWAGAAVANLEPVHHLAFSVRRPDPAFAQHGLLRPTTEPSHKSTEPDLRTPIAFGLRLRQLLGTGARAEVVRVLLTVDAPDLSAAAIAKSAGYTRRNIAEALGDLLRADVIHLTAGGYDQRYGINRSKWGVLLDHQASSFPKHIDWIAITRVLPPLIAWATSAAEPDDYLQGSRALDVLERLDGDLNNLLIIRPARLSTSQDAPLELDAITDQLLALLGR